MSAETTPTVTRRRETTRQRLLDAAAQVFAETGLDAASVEAICERAGFTRGAFYSNFDTKEELFLELCARTGQAQIAAVRERVARFEAEQQSGEPAELVARVLDATADDHVSVLLWGEIRLHALRTPDLASAFLAQEAEMLASVSQIVADIARSQHLTLRTSAEGAARMLLMTWSSTAERAVMAGLDDRGMSKELATALAGVADLLLDQRD